MEARATDPLISIRGLRKSFGDNLVLDGVDLDVRPGEVHALLGENGAGKSTLIKIVAGVESRSDGSVAVAGRELPATISPAEVEDAGLAFVHQDLGLVDTLSVAENIALPNRFEERLGVISFRRTRARAAELMRQIGLDLDPSLLVGELQRDEKVLVAVARAFSLNARAIVLDEVSASLPTPEFEWFARAIKRSTAGGIGYLYVTHRLDEVFDLAQRVTVLRDGVVVGSTKVAETSYDQVVEWIVGDVVEPHRSSSVAVAAPDREAALEVRGLEGPGLEAPLDLDVRAGEIVAVCGLLGSGARSILQLLGGAVPASAGQITLDGAELPLGDPPGLARSGCAYVPGNRDVEGVCADLSIRENLFIAPEPEGSEDLGFIRMPGRERKLAREVTSRFRIVPADEPDRLVATLSGGNRQKVVFARAMRRRPKLLLLDDPTQGVDVGARAQLHALMREAADAGMAILFATSDFEEVAAVADRALVICRGVINGELEREGLSGSRLAQASYEDTRPTTGPQTEATA